MRAVFQTVTRRFGLINKNCCTVDGIELSAIQSHILYEVETKGSPSIQQVADLLGVDITTFSRQIQTLVKMDLIEKVPSNEDKRVTNLVLTEQGKRIAGVIDRQVNDYLDTIFETMSDFERETTQRAIRLLADKMDEVETSRKIKNSSC